MLLSAENITKIYSNKTLLNDISLYLEKGDKIGVIGINGTGKSTFLRIIAQTEDADAGTVTKNSSVRIGYLPQNPISDENLSVLEQVFAGTSADVRDSKEHEAKTILTKLGITDFAQSVAALSGGQKKRVAIAGVLMRPSDVLILDEPTNHLDNETAEWLESYLGKYTGAIVMVTHDRYFLDRVTNRIVEIENGNLYAYPGGYSKYLELKADREEMEIASERKRRSFLRTELAWIRQGAKARGTKSKDRIERFERLSEKSGKAESVKTEMESLSARLGKKTVEIKGITKSFGGRAVITDFEHIILRDDRIGIVGKNGSGKSTLLNIISGKTAPDSGSVEVGETVRMGYFSQNCEEMDLSLRVIDYIKNIAGVIETPSGTVSASQMLEKFLFTPEMQYTAISELSGGERRRLYLLSILMEAPNILLLDEPTNDLDIQTLGVLEDYLNGFSGAVVAVSHDRYFLDKVVTNILEFRGDGTIRKCLGDYSDYLTGRMKDTDSRKAAAPKPMPLSKEKNNPKTKLSFSEQREFETIESEIADLEDQLSGLSKRMEAEASDYAALPKTIAEKEAVEKRLDEKMERWIYLNDLAEKISESKNRQ